MDDYLRGAKETVEGFVSQHGELTFSDKLPKTQGVTNRVLFSAKILAAGK